MLEPRAQHLLKTLIERYVSEGQPVGSRALSRQSGLDLSPATVRNVMADLEEMGFIASPHTSAGRIPTAKGYRFFVDSLMVTKPLEDQEIQRLEGELTADRPQQLVSTAAGLLSQLTQFAGVVMTPRRRDATFRHLEFLRLAERRVLLILVTADADVQNRMIITSRDYTQSELVEATNYVNAHYVGLDIDGMRDRLRGEIVALRDEIALLMQAAVQAGSEAISEGEQVVVSGERNLLGVQDFGHNMGSLRKLFDMFEKKADLMRLLEVSSRAEGVRIYIGGESGAVPFEELSVVSAPYEIDGRVVGTLGVIGPTRMAYDRMVQIVDITSRLVGNVLSHKQ